MGNIVSFVTSNDDKDVVATERSTDVKYDQILSQAKYYPPNTKSYPFYLVQINSHQEKYVTSQNVDVLVTDALVDLIKKEASTGHPFTHVILMAHGWNNTATSAVNEAFGKFVGGLEDDTNMPKEKSFKPLFVGFTWESMPYSVFESDDALDRDDILEMTLQVLDPKSEKEPRDIDSKTVLSVMKAAREHGTTSPVLHDGLHALEKEICADDGVHFCANTAIAELEKAHLHDSMDGVTDGSTTVASRGLFSTAGKVSWSVFKTVVANPIQAMVFGRFIRRGRHSGEVLGAILNKFMTATTECSGGKCMPKYALMGHSLGAHLVSSALLNTSLPHKIHTALIVQGACDSKWYESDGKYSKFSDNVAGPIAATQSNKDGALNFFNRFHGAAIGTIGFPSAIDITMRAKSILKTNPYQWIAGKLYNIEGSEFINDGKGIAGAHGDYKEDETTMTFWSMINMPLDQSLYLRK